MAIEKLEEELEDTELVSEKEKRKQELLEKVVKFTETIRKKYVGLVKSVVVFGSVIRGDVKKTSDVDTWVILDDTETKTSKDLESITTGIYLISEKIKDLHIQVTPLTEFWQWIKIGSPELVNYLKYGLIIYDTGFVKPIQRMMQLGLLPPSEEAINLKTKSAEARYKKIKLDMKAMIFDLRYSATDIIQAVVMQYYKQQPDQKDIPKYLQKLVEEGKIEAEYLEKWKEIDKLWKDVDHKIVKEVDAEYLGKALKLTEEIIDRFKKLLPKEVIEGE